MSLCLCRYVSAMSLCYAVHIGDINFNINFIFCICVTLPLCRDVASVNQSLQSYIINLIVLTLRNIFNINFLTSNYLMNHMNHIIYTYSFYFCYTGPPLIPVLRLKGSPCLNINYYYYYYYYYYYEDNQRSNKAQFRLRTFHEPNLIA